MSGRSVLVLSFALLLVSPTIALPLGGASANKVAYEANEPVNPLQKTCIQAALAWDDELGQCPKLPFESNTQPRYPTAGTTILDAFALSPVAPLQVAPVGQDVNRFAPLDRESNGAVAPILLPGIVAFRAWYGLWEDTNRDNILDVRVSASTQPTVPVSIPSATASYAGIQPGNEYIPADQAKIEGFRELYAFIEPGSRPPLTSDASTSDTEPDFKYGSASSNLDRHYRSTTFVPMIDGSLLEPITVDSVGDAVLISDETTGRPYRTSGIGLVDVDTYVAPFPFVTPLYQDTAAPYVHIVATPGVAACPNQCVYPPLPVSIPGGVLAAAFGRYEHEVDGALANDPRRANTASGRIDDFQAAYRGWIDAMATYTFGAAATAGSPFKKNMPLPGRGESGGVAVLPGTLVSIEAWSGVWLDSNGDGYVGAVDVNDPHDGGNHPMADRYRDHGGEFIPWGVVDDAGKSATLFVTLTPDTVWGDVGVFLWTSAGTPSADQDSCTVLPNGGKVCALLTENTWWRDDTTIRLQFSVYPGQAGHWVSNQYLWFPEGTVNTGFTLCTEPRYVLHEAAGVATPDPVQDCDYVERLAQ